MPVVLGDAAAGGLPARQDVWVLHVSLAGIAAALKKGMRGASGSAWPVTTFDPDDSMRFPMNLEMGSRASGS